jgi:AraC-like DNA-binding protein
MLTTFLIPPHPDLNDFIFNYSLCKSESSIKSLALPWIAHHDTSLCFYLADVPTQISDANAKPVSVNINRITLFGLLTQSRGEMVFEGNYHTFIIEFKPNGFNRLFGIPASDICDGVFSANEVIGNVIEKFYERLVNAVSIRQMVSTTDKFLFGFLNKRKVVYSNDGITRISNQLLTNSLPNISQYACQANMSIRNFERRFTEQVGTSPKLFCRLLRFSVAVQSKMANPEKSWMDIAFDCNYYDSMHMIKEFKQFASVSPVAFFEENPFLSQETFSTFKREAQ